MTTENLKTGSTEAVDLATIQAQMSEEVNAVRNFAFIGVVVFLAGLVFLLVFDTSSIPLQYRLRPALDLAARAEKQYQRQLVDGERNKNKAIERAVHHTTEEAVAWVANHEFGAFVGHGDEPAVVTKVIAGSAAEGAGVKVGATVTKVNGYMIDNSETYNEVMSGLVTGEDVVLTFKSGKTSQPAKINETVDRVALKHDIHHYAHAVEHAIEHHWAEEAEPLNEYLFHAHELKLAKERDEKLAEAARIKVSVTKEDGSQEEIFAVENDLNVVEGSYKAARDSRLILRDKSLNNAGTEFRHKYEAYPEVVSMVVASFVRDETSGNIRLAAATDKEAGKSLGSQIITAASAFYSMKVENKTKIAFEKEYVFPKSQKVENARFAVYESFMKGELAKDFGTPQNPTIAGFDDVDEGKLKVGKAFYVRHCQHCHGVEGAGDGSTAPFLNPRPRIFTHGVFKFRSNTTPKPTIADLKHVLQHGLYGSSMPNFKVFNESDVVAVAHYVRFLAIRGEVEHRVYRQLIETQELIIDDPDENPLEMLRETYDESKEAVYEGWNAAKESVVTPEGEMIDLTDADAVAEAVEKGEKLFRANCASCHGYDGQGGGEQADGMYDSWGQRVNPRNLTKGIYRAGNRPIDLYWRISCGITGAGMPAFNNWPPEDKWAVVTYVKSLAHRPDAEAKK